MNSIFLSILVNDRSNAYARTRSFVLSVRHDTRHYVNSRRTLIWDLRHEGLGLVEDSAPWTKGAVVRATSCARERETHHYIRVYRAHRPILAARQSFKVMYPDGVRVKQSFIDNCTSNIFRPRGRVVLNRASWYCHSSVILSSFNDLNILTWNSVNHN